MRYKLYVLATAIMISTGAAASAQVLAPGPALPGNAVTGGIGPGMTPIAPGLATGPLIEQEGPGGIPLAIGSNDPTRPARHRSLHGTLHGSLHASRHRSLHRGRG
jgi:hypothetical protein